MPGHFTHIYTSRRVAEHLLTGNSPIGHKLATRSPATICKRVQGVHPVNGSQRRRRAELRRHTRESTGLRRPKIAPSFDHAQP